MIDYLTWDSQFFDRRIGRLSTPPGEQAGWKVVDNDARKQGLECVYVLVDVQDTRAVTAAQQKGFLLVDIRLTLSRELPGEQLVAQALPQGVSLRAATTDDLPTLQTIARLSHTDSRFFSDTHFDPARSAEMYAVWIASYLEEADNVTVWTAVQDNEAQGYLTCRVTGQTGRIGLVGLAERARGKGLGTALLACGLDWFARQGAEQVEVVTQGRNLPAQRLYQRGGFRSTRVQLWFHKWYLENEPI